MISVQEAFHRIQQTVHPLPRRAVPLANAVGCTLASAVAADVNSPPHNKSVMDGYAVRSQDVCPGMPELRVIETVAAGDWPEQTIGSGEATRIMTGAPLPAGADAVVMVELTEARTAADGGEWVTIKLDNLPAGRHRMLKADNFAVGDVVFPTGHQIRPTDVGLLAEIGCHTVPTFDLPDIAVLPTGNELVGSQHRPGRGQIRNSNGPMLIAMAKSLGVRVTDLGIGRDDRHQLSDLIAKGLEHEILILTGGVSAGMLDLVPSLLKEQGVEEVFHKVKMKPGKPVWFGAKNSGDGSAPKQTIVFGLPGNPVSGLVGFHLFVRAALARMGGADAIEPLGIIGVLASPHQTRGNRPTYWPARMVNPEHHVRHFEPLAWNGSSDLRALGQADGFIFFPADSHDHPAGEQVRFLPF